MLRCMTHMTQKSENLEQKLTNGTTEDYLSNASVLCKNVCLVHKESHPHVTSGKTGTKDVTASLSTYCS